MVATCKVIGNHMSNKILKVLFNSGSTKTMIHRSALPKGYQCILTLPPLRFQTLGGKTTSNQAIQLKKISFPEFNGNISIDSQTAYSFDQSCRYDIIFGADFLDKFGFTINYNNNILQWMDHEIPLKNPDEFFSKNMLIDLNHELCLNKEDDMFDQEILDNYATRILDAKYEQVDTNRVAANQKQLNVNQRHKLQHLLAKNKKLFDGSLGVYPHQKVHIDLLPGSKLVHH